jgi:hypothetical protein
MTSGIGAASRAGADRGTGRARGTGWTGRTRGGVGRGRSAAADSSIGRRRIRSISCRKRSMSLEPRFCAG